MWEIATNSMRTNLETHNKIIDQAIQEFGGRLFKRIGDATCSTFDSPQQAAQAAKLAAMIPNPRFYDQHSNTRYLNRRIATIQARMNMAEVPK